MIEPAEVTALFTRSDGTFLFSRWGRPIVPVIFGLEDSSIAVWKGAIEAMVLLAGHRMAETDPELGANLLMFFCREWDELAEVPDLDRLVPGFSTLIERLRVEGANQYRVFRFDPDGAIRACFSFVRIDDEMTSVPAETLALSQAVATILLWSDTAFASGAPFLRAGETVVLRPDIGDVIASAYDPVLPAMSRDAATGLRLAARVAGQLRTGRAVEPENYHLTLAFLGEQTRPVLEELHMQLEAVRLPSATVRIRGLDVFGNDPARVVFANVDADAGLGALRDKCRNAARSAGIELGHERFRPHVTLARLGEGSDPSALGRFLEKEGALALEPFKPSDLVLWRSHLLKSGAAYEELARYRLDVSQQAT